MSENTNPMLARIQAVLNKAEGTDNPSEREAYLEKAEQLMQKYSIDAAMLAEAKRIAGGVRETPEKVIFEFMPANDKLGTQWYNLIIAVAEHYDCQFFGWTHGSGYMVGFPSNIELVQMVYTSLRLQALQKLDPKPNKRKSFDENVWTLHESGIKWENIAHLMNKAYHEEKELGRLDRLGLPEDTDGVWSFRVDQERAGWQEVPWDPKKKDGGRLIKACKRWAAELGEPYRAVQSPITFQRSYAQGFLNEVRHRFATLRRYKEEQVASTSGAELVLYDRNKAVQDMMAELKKLMGHKDGRASRQRIVGEAYERGQRDGRTADLGQNRVSGGRKELG